MADLFGDASLFEEFEKDREADSSFIHYDEDSIRSRIVFEGFESDDGEESEDENSNATNGNGSTSEAAVVQPSGTGVENDGRDCDIETKEECVDPVKCDSNEEGKPASVHLLNKNNSSGNGSIPSLTSLNLNRSKEHWSKIEDKNVKMLDEDDTAWLYEHLYGNTKSSRDNQPNLQQLIYERNKFHRYSKILDSTRYVPDDESPAVQLLFNNNSFARKYRQQIEQFIKGLLWQEFNSNNLESFQEITARTGAPSCVDINDKLTSEKRNEKMRQRHTILGNSQFHKQFLIDFLGWPFTNGEPLRCNVNWEIPLYGQVFEEVYADPTTKTIKPAPKKTKPACWNCGQENHSVADCRMPRNPSRIAANRKEFMEKQQEKRSEPKFTPNISFSRGPSRYHLDPELASKFGKFRPGVISDSLREAMGLDADQLPQHIYKMRLFGYPPGWLAEAKQVDSQVSIFDKNGRATHITGEDLEDGELGDGGKSEYDLNKIIEYPGFTVPVPVGIIEEHSKYDMPPIQQHQLKKTLIQQKSSSRKRKLSKVQDEEKDETEAKKVKSDETFEETEKSAEQQVPEEGEIDENEGPKKDSEADTQELVEENGDTHPTDLTPGTEAPKAAMINTSSTISLGMDFGTPILERQKSGLPDASKFAVGTEDHIPFENLPGAVGTFEKMKNLIDVIRKKVRK